MKRKIIIFAIGLLAVVPPLWCSSASAQQKKPPTPVVAVVDMQLVSQSSEAAKSVRAQVQKAQGAYHQTVQGKNDDLRKLDQELQQQRSILSAEAFQQRQKDFEQKVAEAQRDLQDRQGKLEAAYNKAMQQVEATVAEIVGEIARESGYNMVLPKAAVLYATSEMDVTPDVIKRLNAKLPTVSFTIPK